MSSTSKHNRSAASRDPIPDKLFFKIGEVARIAGVEPYVLRYWETEFPQIHPRKGKGGQRLYQREEVDLILLIRDLLHEQGYTIAGARRRMAELKGQPLPEAAPRPSPSTLEAVQNACEGLRDLLKLMDNTDSVRAGSQTDSGRGAVR